MRVGPLQGLERAGRQGPLQDFAPVFLGQTFEITALVVEHPRAAVAAAVLLEVGLRFFGFLTKELKRKLVWVRVFRLSRVCCYEGSFFER